MKPLRILSIVTLIALVGGALFYHSQKPRVFILHSYEPDYVWNEGVNEGLERVTEEWSAVHMNTHYMFAKRFNDEGSLRRAAVQARNAIERWKPDIIIATDNLAQDLVMRDYVNHNDIEIVFAGINGPISAFAYDTARNVTGILEDRSLLPARDAILALRPLGEPEPPWDGSRSIRLRYLLDNSSSVRADQPKIDGFDWAPLDYVGSTSVQSYPDWQAEVLDSAEIADVLIVTNYRQLHRSDADSPFVPRARGAALDRGKRRHAGCRAEFLWHPGWRDVFGRHVTDRTGRSISAACCAADRWRYAGRTGRDPQRLLSDRYVGVTAGPPWAAIAADL